MFRKQMIPPISTIHAVKELPPGSQSLAVNSGNALQFFLEHTNHPDQHFVQMMHEAILFGFFIYLGNDALQITQLGYLFLTPKSKGN
jgi:hypothetical protein